MASDQLNKMRVVGSRDRRSRDVAGSAEPALRTEVSEQPLRRGSRWALAVAFVIAAAVGGASVAYIRSAGVLG